ncbi:MAG: sigma-54 dependent transcriptional regulator [Halieaceae bacterium]|nr:sigma-54 dependent transcriptional regulator [Halieaceae bacterium]
MTQQVLWIDPNQQQSLALRSALSERGIDLCTLPQWSGSSTARWLGQHPDGLVVVNVPITAREDVLDNIFANGLVQPILLRIPVTGLHLASQGFKLGATDVIDSDELNADFWMQTLQTHRNDEVAEFLKPAQKSVIFRDPKSKKLLNLSEKVGKAGVTALLTGPTGCGKEVIARVIHASSNRRQGPFIAVNCAALPEHLIEDMLFGHEKGAFTGAAREQAGYFEQAHGGTLFLDEIAELPIHLQAKLLRALQEKRITRLGGDVEIRLDIRVIAATNQALKDRIAQGLFREDLYYRLSAFQIRIPSLAERPEDILALAEHFLATTEFQSTALHLEACAKAKLKAHSWPGNIRELENVIMRAQILSDNDSICADDIEFDDLSSACSLFDAAHQAFAPAATSGLSDLVKQSEYAAIMDTIQKASTREEAAKQLGISPRTLRHKLQKLRENEPRIAASA